MVPGYARSIQSSTKKTSQPNGPRQPPLRSVSRLGGIRIVSVESKVPVQPRVTRTVPPTGLRQPPPRSAMRPTAVQAVPAETAGSTGNNTKPESHAPPPKSGKDAENRKGKTPAQRSRDMLTGSVALKRRDAGKVVERRCNKVPRKNSVARRSGTASPDRGSIGAIAVGKRGSTTVHPLRRESRNWQATSVGKGLNVKPVPHKPSPEALELLRRIREQEVRSENASTAVTANMFPVTPFVVDSLGSQGAARALHKTASRSTKDSTSVTAKSTPFLTDHESNKKTGLRHFTSKLRRKQSHLTTTTDKTVTSDASPFVLPSIRRDSKHDVLYRISKARSSRSSSKASSLESTPPKVQRLPNAKAHKVLGVGEQDIIDYSDESPPSELGSIARVAPWEAQRDDGTFVTKGEMAAALRERPSGLPKARSESPSPTPEQKGGSFMVSRSASVLSEPTSEGASVTAPSGAPPIPKKSPARLLLSSSMSGALPTGVDAGATPRTPHSARGFPGCPEEEHWEQAVEYIKEQLREMREIDEQKKLEAEQTPKGGEASAQERLRIRGLMAIDNGYQLGLAPDIPFQDMDDNALLDFTRRLEEEIIDNAAEQKTTSRLKDMFFPMRHRHKKYTLQQLQFFARKLKICEAQIEARADEKYNAELAQDEAAAAHAANEKRYSKALEEIDEVTLSSKAPHDFQEAAEHSSRSTAVKHKRQKKMASHPVDWKTGNGQRTPAFDLQTSLTPFVIRGGGCIDGDSELTVKTHIEPCEVMSLQAVSREVHHETEQGDSEHCGKEKLMIIEEPDTPSERTDRDTGSRFGLGITNLGGAVVPPLVLPRVRHKPEHLSISTAEGSVISIGERKVGSQQDREEELHSPLMDKPLVVPASPDIDQSPASQVFKPDRNSAYKQAIALAATDRARKLSGKNSHPAVRGEYAFVDPIPPTPPLRITPPGPKSAPLPSKTFIRKPWDSRHKQSVRIGLIAQGDSDESMVDFDTPSRVYPVQKLGTSLSTQDFHSFQVDASVDDTAHVYGVDEDHNPFRDRRRRDHLAWQPTNMDKPDSAVTESDDENTERVKTTSHTDVSNESQQAHEQEPGTARPPTRKTSRVEIEIEDMINSLQQRSPGKMHTSDDGRDIPRDRDMTEARLELNLDALKMRSETSDARKHPHHCFSWDTEKLMCAQVHNPCNVLPPLPSQPSNEKLNLMDIPSTYFEPKRPRAKPKMRLQRCDNCPKLCCLYAEKLLASSIAARTEDEMHVKKRAEGAADRLRVMFPNGVEDFSSFMECSECQASVCPQCADVCKAALCRQVVCKEHLDAQGLCSLHDGLE